MKVIDLQGRVFGNLTVISLGKRVIANTTSIIYWKCYCICGKEVEIRSRNLRHLRTKSCGCLKGKMCSNGRKQNISGLKFGKLLAVKEFGRNDRNQILWECLCECNKTHYATASDLNYGKVKSCGCYKREVSRQTYLKLSEIQKGINHPSYNPNLTEKDRKYRRSAEFQVWAKNIKVRDNYTCQKCGKIGGRLNSHHLNAYRTHNDLRNELSNGVTLCQSCHTSFHKKYGYKCTESNYIEFKTK